MRMCMEFFDSSVCCMQHCAWAAFRWNMQWRRLAEQMFAVMVEARREGDLANPFAQETAYEAAQGPC